MNYRPPSRPSYSAASGNARAQLFGSTNGSAGSTMRPAKKDAKDAKDGQTVSEQARMLLEEQNNRGIAALSEKVSYMKTLAGDIEAAIQEDHTLLDQTSSTFDRVTMMMKGTLGNVNKMLATGGSKHMCYLVAFIVGLFLTLYWIMK